MITSLIFILIQISIIAWCFWITYKAFNKPKLMPIVIISYVCAIVFLSWQFTHIRPQNNISTKIDIKRNETRPERPTTNKTLEDKSKELLNSSEQNRLEQINKWNNE